MAPIDSPGCMGKFYTFKKLRNCRRENIRYWRPKAGAVGHMAVCLTEPDADKVVTVVTVRLTHSYLQGDLNHKLYTNSHCLLGHLQRLRLQLGVRPDLPNLSSKTRRWAIPLPPRARGLPFRLLLFSHLISLPILPPVGAFQNQLRNAQARPSQRKDCPGYLLPGGLGKAVGFGW